MSVRPSLLVPAALFAAVVAAAACREPDTTTPLGGAPLPDSGTFDRRALRGALAEIVAEEASTFADESASLAAALDGASPGKLDGARAAFRSAMLAWERSEVLQLGPAATSDRPGGQNLRDAIYSWPTTSACLVDQQIVSRAYEAPDFAKTALVSARGLGALEYLLFHDAAENACAPTAAINSAGTWAALAKEELASRRLSFARVVARDVAAQGALLRDAWAATKGNFGEALRTAGEGSAVYATERDALSAVSDALFYLEASAKDRKLAPLVGIANCASASCPEAVELPHSGLGALALRKNLEGFGLIMFGRSGDAAALGLDDLLAAVGAQALADRMRQDHAAALAAVDALGAGPLAKTLASDPAKVRAAHDAVKRLTDDLKTDFVTVLSLELPARVDGDND